ncbi:hypothetical protein ES332_A12G050200v1 [Gossypium tomentosum]|uniref:Uncharacterized protein n=1 Tax=Gossypium tomentosum TaxID=34277 RepID=A0A5D2MSW2_GOSTO|nr:hypothetical protein ES332_A12G050200v1 [Gossypium tomentosum]
MKGGRGSEGTMVMADYGVHRRSTPPPLHQSEATRTTGTGRVLALGMRVAYGVVDVAVGGVGAEFGCGVRERTLGFRSCNVLGLVSVPFES